MVVGYQDFGIRDLEYSVWCSEVARGETFDVSGRVSKARKVKLVDCAARGTVVYGK